MSYARHAGRPADEPVTIVPGGMDTPIPDAPLALDEVGREMWTRLWTVGRSWLSNDAHYDLMRVLCEVMQRREVIAKAAARARPTVKGSMGQVRVNPIFDELRKLEVQSADLLKLAKFTPDPKKQPVAPRQRSRLDALAAAR